jgi:hypothetical protein
MSRVLCGGGCKIVIHIHIGEYCQKGRRRMNQDVLQTVGRHAGFEDRYRGASESLYPARGATDEPTYSWPVCNGLGRFPVGHDALARLLHLGVWRGNRMTPDCSAFSPGRGARWHHPPNVASSNRRSAFDHSDDAIALRCVASERTRSPSACNNRMRSQPRLTRARRRVSSLVV